MVKEISDLKIEVRDYKTKYEVKNEEAKNLKRDLENVKQDLENLKLELRNMTYKYDNLYTE